MKKVFFTLFAFGLASAAAFAQDDVYFVPTKKAIAKERQAKRQAEQKAAAVIYESTYAPIDAAGTTADYDTWADNVVNPAWDVDAYNRRGKGMLVNVPADSLQNDSISFADYVDDDISATARIVRFRSPRAAIVASPYYSDYYAGLAYYDPWYFDTWYDPFFHTWYDPWYYRTYGGWGWHHGFYSGWYGGLWDYGWGYHPYYYSAWTSPFYWGYYGWHHHYDYGWGHGGHHGWKPGSSNNGFAHNTPIRGGHSNSHTASLSHGGVSRGTFATRGTGNRTTVGTANGVRPSTGRSTDSYNSRFGTTTSRTGTTTATPSRGTATPSRGTATPSRGTATPSRGNSSSSSSGSYNAPSRGTSSSSSNHSYSSSSRSSSSYSSPSRGSNSYSGSSSRSSSGSFGGGSHGGSVSRGGGHR